MEHVAAMLRLVAACLLCWAQPVHATEWSAAVPAAIVDDDLARHADEPGFLDGLTLSELRFSENGFDWHLIRFTSTTKPDGPLWMVPHDDENAAFEAMIAAIKLHGGTGIAVNSGPGSMRRQPGYGRCGVRPGNANSCDPNRNFAETAPLFTAAFLKQLKPGQPVIALHTNSHGFSGDGQGGRGDITILDAAAFGKGVIRARKGGFLGNGSVPALADYDTLGLMAWRAAWGRPDDRAVACRTALNQSGIHFWHELVERSDGSMSNYLVLNRPDIAYFNAESRTEIDLAVAASRHILMVDAYLKYCQPPPQ